MQGLHTVHCIAHRNSLGKGEIPLSAQSQLRASCLTEMLVAGKRVAQGQSGSDRDPHSRCVRRLSEVYLKKKKKMLSEMKANRQAAGPPGARPAAGQM